MIPLALSRSISESGMGLFTHRPVAIESRPAVRHHRAAAGRRSGAGEARDRRSPHAIPDARVAIPGLAGSVIGRASRDRAQSAVAR